MKAIFLAILMGLCLLTASVANAEGKTKFTKHFNESLFNITEKGEFSIEILLDEKEYKIGKNVIGIVIHNKHNEDVEGADIQITLTNEQGQNITGSPVVKEKGEGLYTVANLNIQREGRLELKIRVKKKDIIDSAGFVFPDVTKERFPAGKYTE